MSGGAEGRRWMLRRRFSLDFWRVVVGSRMTFLFDFCSSYFDFLKNQTMNEENTLLKICAKNKFIV